MDQLKTINDGEIDIIDIFETLWNGKWKIIIFSIITLIAVFGYLTLIHSNSNFKAITKISPISSAEKVKYTVLKDIRFPVSQELFFDLYIEQLQEKFHFQQAIKEHKLLDFEEYENDKDYNQAIVDLSAKISINKIDKDSSIWNVSFNYNDAKKWKKVLTTVDILSNQAVRNVILSRFDNVISIMMQNNKDELEEIKVLIKNSKEDYYISTNNRLAFLKEQAIIARKLEISKNTNNLLTFDANDEVVTAFREPSTPFYFRGYIPIEAEIELIESRVNIMPFIPNMNLLEKNKRDLEHNIELKNIKRKFLSSPINKTNNNFKAAFLYIDLTKYEYITNKMTYILIIVISVILSSIYILISNSIRKRNQLL